jgi:hypothetical protein
VLVRFSARRGEGGELLTAEIAFSRTERRWARSSRSQLVADVEEGDRLAVAGEVRRARMPAMAAPTTRTSNSVWCAVVTYK